MKNRTDHILLAVFVSTLAFYVILLWSIQYPLPDWLLWFSEIRVWLVVCFHFVPAFCLQLLAARRAKRRWLAPLPTILVTVWLAFCLNNWLNTTGWDTLGWSLLLWGSIAPVVGCMLAWTAYGFHRLYKRGDICG